MQPIKIWTIFHETLLWRHWKAFSHHLAAVSDRVFIRLHWRGSNLAGPKCPHQHVRYTHTLTLARKTSHSSFLFRANLKRWSVCGFRVCSAVASAWPSRSKKTLKDLHTTEGIRYTDKQVSHMIKSIPQSQLVSSEAYGCYYESY